jgi:hypothetical protein
VGLGAARKACDRTSSKPPRKSKQEKPSSNKTQVLGERAFSVSLSSHRWLLAKKFSITWMNTRGEAVCLGEFAAEIVQGAQFFCGESRTELPAMFVHARGEP